MASDELWGAAITESVIGSAMEVSNVLGAGFLEKVYERAMIRELTLRGVRVKGQYSYSVLYKGQCVGTYAADLVVEERVLVELKCVERLGREHLAQCLNYLRASGLTLGLVINFQRSRLDWRRVALGFDAGGARRVSGEPPSGVPGVIQFRHGTV